MTLGEKWNVKTGLLLVKGKQISDPLATVYRGVKNIRAGRGVEQQEGSGRLRKLNETDRSRLGQLVRFEKFKTLTSFRNEMIERRSPAVFKQTMHNELNSLDWEKKRAFPAPSLTDR